MSGEILERCDICGREVVVYVQRRPGNVILCSACMVEEAERPSPGLAPPRPVGCPNCAQAEAQCDRMAQRIRELEAEGADMAFVGHMIAAERAQDRIRELESALAFRDADVAALSLEIKRLNDLSEWWHSRVEHLLGYLSEIRVACGDGGKREGQELVDYLRILWEEADPDRVSAREAELRAQDYAAPHDPSDAGAWGEDRFEERDGER